MTTLDPANKAVQVTLSNANLTAVSSTIGRTVYSTTTKTVGKWFFEVTTTNDGSGNNEFGIGSVTNQNVNAFLESSGGVGFTYAGGGVWNDNGGGGGTSNTYTPGATFTASVCLDLDINLLYLIVDGTHKVWGDADTSTGGVSLTPDAAGFFAGLVPISGGASLTINFGATAFVAAIPVGFSSWDIPTAPPTTLLPQALL